MHTIFNDKKIQRVQGIYRLLRFPHIIHHEKLDKRSKYHAQRIMTNIQNAHKRTLQWSGSVYSPKLKRNQTFNLILKIWNRFENGRKSRFELFEYRKFGHYKHELIQYYWLCVPILTCSYKKETKLHVFLYKKPKRG